MNGHDTARAAPDASGGPPARPATPVGTGPAPKRAKRPRSPFAEPPTRTVVPDGAARALPAVVVGGRPHRNGRGNLDWTLPLAARMAELLGRYGDDEEPRKHMHRGTLLYVPQARGEFHASLHAVLASVYGRTFKSAREHPPGRSRALSDFDGADNYRATYERVRKAASRSTPSGVVVGAAGSGTLLFEDRGHAIPEGLGGVRGKVRDKGGKRWVPAGPLTGVDAPALRPDPPLPAVLCTVETERQDAERRLRASEGHVAVLSEFERIVAVEEALHVGFRASRTWDGRRSWGTTADGLRWQRRVIDHKREPGRDLPERHVGVGAFRAAEAGTEDDALKHRRACTVPFLVAEFDGPSPPDSYDAARQLVGRLAEAGLDPARVVVSFSGRRSFHVRLPHAALGCPVYRDARTAKRVIEALFDRVAGDLPRWEYVDRNKFSPNGLIRVVGSLHPTTKNRCVGMTGAAFLDLPLDHILTDSEHGVVRLLSLADPAKGGWVGPLVDEVKGAVARVREDEVALVGRPTMIYQGKGGGTGEIAQLLEHGAVRGSRNDALNKVALHRFQRAPDDEARRSVYEWDQTRNAEPLQDEDPAGFAATVESARRAAQATRS